MTEIPKLHFVELEEIFRLIGKVPQWAIDEGYNPKTDRQVAIFGEKEVFSQWQQEKGLNTEKYPIHEASMGFHIDVYGEAMIAVIIAQDGMMTGLDYFRDVLRK